MEKFIFECVAEDHQTVVKRMHVTAPSYTDARKKAYQMLLLGDGMEGVWGISVLIDF